ncbi:HAMP domain-containing sensor histidine kinase [Anaerocolumna xylanovorans]|uniref:histidine kinase n=1 Tax=Anaerocolumna xylanovorans DSM 12503 TaxID=1121345 RepID=A0A1M7YM97_9FIRM|nr:HAMP domain-containing sensor histidine kinase [Anaerocolumna xylanovorans]SHO53803.1 Signal transduction histidine kinase [Anaerocolumna xylanovorans DSM 12503]
MKTRLFAATACFAGVILILSLLLAYSVKPENAAERKAEHIVALNEISQMAQKAASGKDTSSKELLKEKIAALNTSLREEEHPGNARLYPAILFIGTIAVIYLFLIFLYIYFSILRPFDKLKGYAQSISKGDFDVSLNYERSNYFGAFTWAFDHMRREITRARACEQEAIDNNKTVIATLSHDIKTPIASIRAYAEGLEANMDTTAEKRVRYLSVIMKKCDDVTKLTNDLFLHSISDLDKLKVVTEKVELCGYLSPILEEINAGQGDVAFQKPYACLYVDIDKNRFQQLVENLINNARKYAKTKIEVSIKNEDRSVTISFRDYGQGAASEDMPFLFDKFYRGKNCGKEQGSGLGLYIVRYVAEQMKGEVRLINHTDGLEVTVNLPLIS